ncbi:MAG TPA: extracellular solute-binding protein [Anaerolineae bacterium]|nr:extracellular solute-binding protein [Anaerolineae bacterium]
MDGEHLRLRCASPQVQVSTNRTRMPFEAIFRLLLLGWLLGIAGCQAPPPQPSTVTITFAAFEFDRKAYESLMAAFHETRPNIEVQFVSLEQALSDDRYDPASVAAAADTAVIRSTSPGSAASFHDPMPFVEADPAFNASDFWPGLLTACQDRGRVAGVPVGASPSLIFFDGAAFDAAGLPRPAPGWTWNDFQGAARVLTRREGSQVTRYGFVPSGDPFSLVAPVADAMLTVAGGQLNAPTLSGALGWLVDLAREGALPAIEEDPAGLEHDEALIANAQAAMWIDSLINLQWRRSILGPSIGLAPFPISADGSTSHTTPMTPVCVAMSSGTAHPQEAWAWLSFLTMQSMTSAPDAVSARPSVAEASDFWTDLTDETRLVLRFALEHAWYGSQHPEALRTARGAFAQALTGETDLTSALDSMTLPIEATPLPATTPVVVAAPRPTPEAGGIVTVDYYASGFVHPSPNAIEALAQQFNRAHPGIEARPSDDLAVPAYHVFTVADVAKQYDCLAWSNASGEALDQFYSLDPLLAAEDQSLIAGFDPALLDALRVNGKLYALPATSLPMVIYYNADHLDKMGLQPPDPDWTVDDFVSLAAAATSGETENKTYGFVPFQADSIGFLFAAQGVELYDLSTEPPTIHFDDPDTARAVQWMVDLIHSGIMSPLTGDLFHATAERLVVSGHAAMWSDFAGLRGGFVQDEPADFKVGVAPPPVAPARLPPPLVYGFYISRRVEEPSACWSWIKFLSEQPSAFIGVPARRSVTESKAWEAAVGVDTAEAYRAAVSRPVSSQHPDWRVANWLEQALAASLEGEEPAAALADAQHKVDTFLACLAAAPGDDSDQRDACARQADPEFKTLQELLDEDAP